MTELITAPDMRMVAEGLEFPEAPRWWQGDLFVSDVFVRRVYRIGPKGALETVAEVPARPSGLGWLPDGRMLIVSMEDQRLLRLENGLLTVVADLTRLATGGINDMVVDPKGRAYIGDVGYDYFKGESPQPSVLILVDVDLSARIVADKLATANGIVISPDGRTLITGETHGKCLTAFDISSDGQLSNRRAFASLPEGPDGICLDAEGAIWVAVPTLREVLRVREGGVITHRVLVGDYATACTLGGSDRTTLFICSAALETVAGATVRGGRIRAVEVEVPGVGWP